MITREPKKGRGVPKETPEQNSIADLQRALASHFAGLQWDGLRAALEQRGFFEASMQQRVRIMAEVSVEQIGHDEDLAALLPALAASPVEKVRGIAPYPSSTRAIYRPKLGRYVSPARWTAPGHASCRPPSYTTWRANGACLAERLLTSVDLGG